MHLAATHASTVSFVSKVLFTGRHQLISNPACFSVFGSRFPWPCHDLQYLHIIFSWSYALSATSTQALFSGTVGTDTNWSGLAEWLLRHNPSFTALVERNFREQAVPTSINYRHLCSSNVIFCRLCSFFPTQWSNRCRASPWTLNLIFSVQLLDVLWEHFS